MKRIEVLSKNQTYSVAYEREGSGFPTIFVHGSYRSSYVWQRNAPVFAHQYDTIVFDRPGYGDSPLSLADDELPDMCDFLAAFADKLGVTAANWIGESRGGGLCIQVAARYPKLVANLVLVSPVGLPPSELPKPEAFEESYVVPWFIRRSFDDDLMVDEALRRTIEVNVERSLEYESFRNTRVSGTYAQTGLLEDMILVGARCMLIWGSQDPVFPCESMQRFREIMPSICSTLLIPRGRHLVHFEQSEIWNSKVLDFLSGKNGGQYDV